jgi:hypothetical protein
MLSLTSKEGAALRVLTRGSGKPRCSGRFDWRQIAAFNRRRRADRPENDAPSTDHPFN